VLLRTAIPAQFPFVTALPRAGSAGKRVGRSAGKCIFSGQDGRSKYPHGGFGSSLATTTEENEIGIGIPSRASS